MIEKMTNEEQKINSQSKINGDTPIEEINWAVGFPDCTSRSFKKQVIVYLVIPPEFTRTIGGPILCRIDANNLCASLGKKSHMRLMDKSLCIGLEDVMCILSRPTGSE